MADLCGECLKLDWSNKESNTSQNKYYCNTIRKYVSPQDLSCSYFSSDKSVKKETNSGDYTPSGCPITMIIRDILGYEDNCELLASFRSFRENFLKKNATYIPMLLEYDQLSFTISECIEREENKQHFCLELTQRFLLPLGNSIKEGNAEDAITTYKNFLDSLKIKFGLMGINIDLNASYDIETLGKGRTRLTPKASEC